LPIYEPHLLKLIEEGRRSENLVFTSDVVSALAEAEIWWISYDTEVNNQDEADINKVIKYFEIVESDLNGKPRVIKPLEYGLKYFSNPKFNKFYSASLLVLII
jgi:UDP-glucose 6-dehydrogenase